MALERNARDGVLHDALECDAWMRLALARGIGPRTVRIAAETAGSAVAALSQPDAWWLQFPHACRLRDLGAMLRAAREVDLGAERAAAQRHDAQVLSFPQIPDALQDLHDPPSAIWVRGTLPPPEFPSVAIVGSRSATAYGRIQAARFAAELAELGVVIVSGGARGIDAEAHRAALRVGGRTVAVLGGGLDHVYPSEHAPLFEAIVESGGAVITEFACGVSPRPEYFPRRNRIVSGLSLVVLVVEAAERSGALLTARLAVEEQGREVACLPGPVDSTRSAGCHRAIREGWAHLAHEPQDVAELILSQRSLAIANLPLRDRRADGPAPTVTARSSVPDAERGSDTRGHASASSESCTVGASQGSLNSAERALLDALRGAARCGDELADLLDLPWQKVAPTLTALAAKGLARHDGKHWVCLAPP